jgi:exonuclease-1
LNWTSLTGRFVDYAMHRVRMLRHFGITPYVVFDGGPLPAKRGTEALRAKSAASFWLTSTADMPRSRADYYNKARSLESQGRPREARECYTKCLDITPEMAYQLIKVSS